jgi:hypothetical protein
VERCLHQGAHVVVEALSLFQRTLFEFGKEAGKLMVLEVGSFLSLRTRLQAWV